MIRVPLLAMAVVSFALYAYAIARVFRREGGVDRKMRALQFAGSVSALVHVGSIALSREIGPALASASFVLYCIALLVFAAALRAMQRQPLTLAFTDDTPDYLLERGVYRYVRHPFYTAYSLTWLAGVLAARGVATVLSAASMMAMYVWAARLEEAKFLRSAHSESYREYRRRAGAFWPRFRTLVGRC